MHFFIWPSDLPFGAGSVRRIFILSSLPPFLISALPTRHWPTFWTCEPIGKSCRIAMVIQWGGHILSRKEKAPLTNRLPDFSGMTPEETLRYCHQVLGVRERSPEEWEAYYREEAEKEKQMQARLKEIYDSHDDSYYPVYKKICPICKTEFYTKNPRKIYDEPGFSKSECSPFVLQLISSLYHNMANSNHLHFLWRSKNHQKSTKMHTFKAK